MNTKFNIQWLRLAAVLTLLLAALAPVRPAYAESCLVTTDADSGAGSLREKITDPTCDTITFGGDYTIVLASPLTIDRNVTIDGIGHGVTVNGNHAVRVFEVVSGVTFRLNNLTIANGYAGTTLAYQGGGIYNQGTLQVTNGVFHGNSALGMGGGIYSHGDALTVTGSTFFGNSSLNSNGGGLASTGGVMSVVNSAFSDNNAKYSGGGIYAIYMLNVTNSTFTDNSVGTWGQGGGIFYGGAYDDGTVTNSTFTGNSALYGGGIVNMNTLLNVTNSTFTDNSAISGGGGGLFNDRGTVTLTNNIFSENRATHYGGAIHNVEGTINATKSIFTGNTAQYMTGGGISNYRGTINVANSTFSSNSAPEAGGIYNTAGTATITNSTVSGNYEGGIVNSTGTVAVMNTIVANNTEGNCINSDPSTFTGSNNLADDDSCGPGFAVSSSILLAPLADNGGPTQTMALLPGSVAIDAGDDVACPGTDQRGVARPQGMHCDIGAYEVEITATDTTAPAITLTAPAEDAVYLLGQTVNADYACQDEDGGSGLASCTGTVANGSPIDTGSIGTKTFTVNAADQANNTATVTHTYHVIYNFTGFTSPVDNPPSMNIAKAGQTLPLKWRLTDANGNPVTNLTSVSVMAASLSCPSAQTTDAIEQYVTSNSGLQNLGDGYYQWNWKSPGDYANSCRTLKLDLGEGAGLEHLALFQFKK